MKNRKTLIVLGCLSISSLVFSGVGTPIKAFSMIFDKILEVKFETNPPLSSNLRLLSIGGITYDGKSEQANLTGFKYQMDVSYPQCKSTFTFEVQDCKVNASLIDDANGNHGVTFWSNGLPVRVTEKQTLLSGQVKTNSSFMNNADFMCSGGLGTLFNLQTLIQYFLLPAYESRTETRVKYFVFHGAYGAIPTSSPSPSATSAY